VSLGICGILHLWVVEGFGVFLSNLACLQYLGCVLRFPGICGAWGWYSTEFCLLCTVFVVYLCVVCGWCVIVLIVNVCSFMFGVIDICYLLLVGCLMLVFV